MMPKAKAKKGKGKLTYINCNGRVIDISDDARMYGPSWLWDIAMCQKNKRVGSVMQEIHGVFCSLLSARKVECLKDE